MASTSVFLRVDAGVIAGRARQRALAPLTFVERCRATEVARGLSPTVPHYEGVSLTDEGVIAAIEDLLETRRRA